MFDISLQDAHDLQSRFSSRLLYLRHTRRLIEKNKHLLIDGKQEDNKKKIDPVPRATNKKRLRSFKNENNNEEESQEEEQQERNISRPSSDLTRRDLFGLNCSYNQRMIKKRRLPPDETYELWHQETSFNKGVMKALSSSRKKYSDDVSTEENEQVNEDQEEEEPEEDDEGDPEKVYKGYQYRMRNGAKREHSLKKRCLEVLPRITLKPLNSLGIKAPGWMTRHVVSVLKLMHMNILKRNWKLAYRCFALVLRIDDVEIRDIWPLGMEILQRLMEEEAKETNPELTTYEFNSQDFLHIKQPQASFEDEDHTQSESQFQGRDIQFSEWLQTAFPPFKTYDNRKFWHLPMVYRWGTRESSPAFTTTAIWTLIMRRDFDKAKEKLEGLLLTEPYVKDGMYHYMLGVCFFYEAVILGQDYTSLDLDRLKIERLTEKAKKSFESAKRLDFNVPDALMDQEFEALKSKLNEVFESNNNGFNSEPEDIDSDGFGDEDNEANDNGSYNGNDKFQLDDDVLDKYERNLNSSGPATKFSNPDSDFEDGQYSDNRHGSNGYGSSSMKIFRNPDSESE